MFDLETTGLDIVRDRIFQLSYIKVYPDGKEERENIFVNPGKEIPQEVVELTGTSNADVADKPTFKALAPELAEKFANCDFAGFNSNHFDLPMLAEEFYRAGINYDFSQCRLIDAQTIFHKMERRNLAAAYKFYCGRKMEDDFDAHRAELDELLAEHGNLSAQEFHELTERDCWCNAKRALELGLVDEVIAPSKKAL